MNENIKNRIVNAENKFVGLKQLIRDASNVNVKVVILADDADLEIKNLVIEKCKKENYELSTIPTMTELGKLAKIDVKASVITLYNN